VEAAVSLALGRRIGESIDLTDSRTGEWIATITVTKIAGGQCRLAFDCPDHVRILRAELQTQSTTSEK
jgi:carbon storage regulator CsrA